MDAITCVEIIFLFGNYQPELWITRLILSRMHTCVTWSRFNREICHFRRGRRAKDWGLGKVFPHPVPALINESWPWYVAKHLWVEVPRGTWVPLVTTHASREALAAVIRSSTPRCKARPNTVKVAVPVVSLSQHVAGRKSRFQVWYADIQVFLPLSVQQKCPSTCIEFVERLIWFPNLAWEGYSNRHCILFWTLLVPLSTHHTRTRESRYLHWVTSPLSSSYLPNSNLNIPSSFYHVLPSLHSRTI